MCNTSEDNYIEIPRLLPLLPYADQLDSYAEIAGSGLKESLRRLLSSSTYASHNLNLPRLIHNYIRHFGMRFTKKEVIDIVHFGLSLVFCPQVDKANRDLWEVIVTHLLSFSNSYIEKKELQLDWRKFYAGFTRRNLCVDYCDEVVDLTNQDRQLLTAAISFFTTSCVEEIWQHCKHRIYSSLIRRNYANIFNTLLRYTPCSLEHFEEIKRVWLDEIIHIWYQHPESNIHAGVINLLAKFSRLFPGRLDMDPHLERIFNYLVVLFLGQIGQENILRPSAEIIAYSITPKSNVLKLLRRLFHFCENGCHISSKNARRGSFPVFCCELITVVSNRLQRELHSVNASKKLVDEVVDWARLTKEQVDEFVEIVLPACLEINIYTQDTSEVLNHACNAISHLSSLRPRLVFPALVESIEEGFSTPQLPLRITRPLRALSTCINGLFVPFVMPHWGKHIGFHPMDQLHNFSTEGDDDSKFTAEQRRQWASYLSDVVYPEGRALIPRILNICLSALDLNQKERLESSLRILKVIFLATPIKDHSDSNPPGPENNDQNGEEGGLMHNLLKEFSTIKMPPFSLVMEDIVVKIFQRIFYLMEKENENSDFRFASNGPVQMSSGARSVRSAALMNFLASSSSVSPGLRARLVKLCLDSILQNHWTPMCVQPIINVLFSLLCVSPSSVSNAATDASESDVALFALKEFWTRFMHSYNELKSDNALVHEGKVEPRIIVSLYLVDVFIFVFVPARLKEVESNFINPLIEVLFELLTISLGSGDESPPSKELVNQVSNCLGSLLYRLVTFSMDFRGVDLFNSTGFATDPLWTPFVGYRRASDYVKWIRPTEETFALATSILRRFFLPLLNKLSAVSDELNAFLVGSKSDFPQIPWTSGQSKVVYQKAYLMSLAHWIVQISNSLFEGLKPRDISHEDVDYINEICSELELLRHEAVACPESSLAAKSIKLDIPFFDLPSEDGSSLRDQIFRCGLRFLDIMAKLSAKFDAQTNEAASRSSGQSVIGNLHSLKEFQIFMAAIRNAGFNQTEYSMGQGISDFKIHPQTKIKYSYIGTHFGYLEPETISNYAISGPSSEFLSALVAGEIPTIRCGGGGNCGMSYLPIVWIMCARKLHLNFISRIIGRHSTWPGTEASALFSYPLFPVNRQLTQYVETSIQLGLNCFQGHAYRILADIHNVTCFGVSGGHVLLARRLIEAMEPFYTGSVYTKSDTEYRVCSYRLGEVLNIIGYLLCETIFPAVLYHHDPWMWSTLWITMLKLSILSNFGNMQLTEAQIRERTNDQAMISKRVANILEKYGHFPRNLYFHSNYDPNAHPKNTYLRHLILSAQKLHRTLGGSEEEMVELAPSLLMQTAKLRRDAHRYLVHSIDQKCLRYIDFNTNSAAVILHLNHFEFHTDFWDTLPMFSATPDTLPFLKTAPPPPSPLVSTISNVLRLISSQNIGLAYSATVFIIKFLSSYLLISRDQDFVWVDPRAFKWSNTCTGYENEPQYDCLAAENFNLENILFDYFKSFKYFRPPYVMKDPCSNAVFPIISDMMDSGFKVDPSRVEWLEVRSEMDLSPLSSEDSFNWHEGLKIIAEFFASPEFWTEMSHVVLKYHNYKSPLVKDTLKELIYLVLVCFGPRPYLQRVEAFLMSLLKPALAQECTSFESKYAGLKLVNDALIYVGQGSHYWPREMRLLVYGRVLPRLIVYSEAAAQLASADFSHESSSVRADNLKICYPDFPSENIDNVASLIETELSTEGDRLVKQIYCDKLRQEEDDENKPKEADSIKVPDPYGPKLRAPHAMFTILNVPNSDDMNHIYSSYIWKFFSQLASDDGGKSTSQEGDACCCDHRVPEGYGECPLCVGRLLFTRSDQRRALRYQLMLLVFHSNVWNLLHHLKHFIDADAIGSWEEDMFSDSHWARSFACRMSLQFSAAGFNRLLTSLPSTIRLYTHDVEHPVCCERQVSSALETELLSRLSAFESPELRRLASCGPDFLMKRFLPLLVRDWMAVLLLRDFCPSSASFVLQENLLFDAAERLTPATKELLSCSKRTKFFAGKQITLRLCFLMDFVMENIWLTFPANAYPDSSSESAFDVFYRLAPLLADHFATSDRIKLDWRFKHDGSVAACLDMSVISNLKKLQTIAVMGHTNSGVGITQANRMLDFFEVFLRHSEWKTRFCGLMFMKNLALITSTFWIRDEAGDALRMRLKRRLCELLADPWIDVAKTASVTISNCLSLSFLEYDELWFRELTMQSRVKLPTLQKGKAEITGQEKDAAMLLRRAGVFGLCAIIRANPHDTPDYLPAVIAEVANHANDPHPIGKFVADTLMEYSRCHIDRWLIRDRAKFTEDQLDNYLSVVSGVNYYV